MRRVFALLLCLVLLGACARAEEAAMPALDQEQCAQIVEALFVAAVGTDLAAEETARKGADDEAIAQRNIENALYRAKTRPWLAEVLMLDQPEEDAESDEPAQALAEPQEPVWTTEDSCAAMQSNAHGQAYLALLEGLGAQEKAEQIDLTQEALILWLEGIDHDALMQMNGDYDLWLYAPGTQIDYPVVQGEDNDYYLRRLFNGRWNSAGTLFIDYRNLPGLQDPNTLIYGHHMRNDSMFGTLTDYEEQAYYEAHPYMLAISPDEICLVEFFAGYTTSDKDHCYDIAISDEEDMRLFIDTALEKTDFAAGVLPGTGDRLLTLSTCAYAFRDARYILIGRLAPMWQAAGAGEMIPWQ